MSLCLFSRRAPTSDAMSFGDIGGNGPPHHSNAAPVPPNVQSVRRSLFGPVDHVQTKRDLEEELRKCDEQNMRDYNFDFARELPLSVSDARYDWTRVSTTANTSVTPNETADPTDPTDKHTDQQTTSTNTCIAISQSSPTLSTTITTSTAATTITTTSISNSTVEATSVSISLDSECVARASSPTVAHIDASDANKSDITVKLTKQSQITAFLRGRKSGENERKRSGAKSVSDEDRLPKRHRPDASPSAAKVAQCIDTADDDDDEESVQT